MTAIAEVTAEWDVDHAVEDRERAALVLIARHEIAARPVYGVRNVHRPPWQRRAVFQRESKHAVAGSVRCLDRGVKVDRTGVGIDDWRAGDSERADIPTR